MFKFICVDASMCVYIFFDWFYVYEYVAMAVFVSIFICISAYTYPVLQVLLHLYESELGR